MLPNLSGDASSSERSGKNSAKNKGTMQAAATEGATGTRVEKKKEEIDDEGEEVKATEKEKASSISCGAYKRWGSKATSGSSKQKPSADTYRSSNYLASAKTSAEFKSPIVRPQGTASLSSDDKQQQLTSQQGEQNVKSISSDGPTVETTKDEDPIEVAPMFPLVRKVDVARKFISPIARYSTTVGSTTVVPLVNVEKPAITSDNSGIVTEPQRPDLNLVSEERTTKTLPRDDELFEFKDEPYVDNLRLDKTEKMPVQEQITAMPICYDKPLSFDNLGDDPFPGEKIAEVEDQSKINEKTEETIPAINENARVVASGNVDDQLKSDLFLSDDSQSEGSYARNVSANVPEEDSDDSDGFRKSNDSVDADDEMEVGDDDEAAEERDFQKMELRKAQHQAKGDSDDDEEGFVEDEDEELVSEEDTRDEEEDESMEEEEVVEKNHLVAAYTGGDYDDGSEDMETDEKDPSDVVYFNQEQEDEEEDMSGTEEKDENGSAEDLDDEDVGEEEEMVGSHREDEEEYYEYKKMLEMDVKTGEEPEEEEFSDSEMKKVAEEVARKLEEVREPYEPPLVWNCICIDTKGIQVVNAEKLPEEVRPELPPKTDAEIKYEKALAALQDVSDQLEEVRRRKRLRKMNKIVRPSKQVNKKKKHDEMWEQAKEDAYLKNRKLREEREKEEKEFAIMASRFQLMTLLENKHNLVFDMVPCSGCSTNALYELCELENGKIGIDYICTLCKLKLVTQETDFYMDWGLEQLEIAKEESKKKFGKSIGNLIFCECRDPKDKSPVLCLPIATLDLSKIPGL